MPLATEQARKALCLCKMTSIAGHPEAGIVPLAARRQEGIHSSKMYEVYLDEATACLDAANCLQCSKRCLKSDPALISGARPPVHSPTPVDDPGRLQMDRQSLVSLQPATHLWGQRTDSHTTFKVSCRACAALAKLHLRLKRSQSQPEQAKQGRQRRGMSWGQKQSGCPEYA